MTTINHNNIAAVLRGLKFDLRAYLRGRDIEHRAEFERMGIANAAADLLLKTEALLTAAVLDGVALEASPTTRSVISSGWRPAAVNAATPGAAVYSRHMRARAIDLYDPDGELDDWCMDHLPELERIGFWLEHPSATKGWCHLQDEPPRSGKRVFYP